MSEHLKELIFRFPILEEIEDNIFQMYNMLFNCFNSGKSLFVAGNGGSSSDSGHIVGELVKSFAKKRPLDDNLKHALSDIDSEIGNSIAKKLDLGLPAFSLCEHSALITAISNDVDSDLIYAQQLISWGTSGDIFLGISTSGNSKNIINALVLAKAKGMKTILLSGKDGGISRDYSDCCVIVPVYETYKIQELHLPIYHAICLQLEDDLF